MGDCHNYGPFLGTLNIRCSAIIGIHKGHHTFDNHLYSDCSTTAVLAAHPAIPIPLITDFPLNDIWDPNLIQGIVLNEGPPDNLTTPNPVEKPEVVYDRGPLRHASKKNKALKP